MKTSVELTIFAACFLFAGCATSKDVLYFQDIDVATIQKLAVRYEAVIKKDDELTIIITSPDKSVVDPYNFTIGNISESYTTHSSPETPIISCVVDADGNITFPIFGKIHVEGMTRLELVKYLEDRIGDDVRDPIVFVSFKNFKFTVLGEVRNPGTYTYKTEKLNVLQALGYAGDLTVAAKRDGILLIREVDGVQRHVRIDLRQSSLLNSPVFYLQQNDIIYVPPSATRLMSANSSTGIWSAVSSIASTVSVTIALLALIL